MAISTSSTTAARLFDETFHPQARSLDHALSSITTLPTAPEKSKALNEALEGIADLQRSVQDASSYSNNHDQAVYASTLKKLQASAENVRNAITPKSRFKFKAARQMAAKADASVDGMEGQNLIRQSGSESDAATTGKERVQTAPPPEALLKNEGLPVLHSRIVLSAQRLSEVSTKSIQNVTKSVIDLATHQQEPSASLSITDVSTSILFCGNIEGPLHMTSIKSSLIFARAHQIRIHDCEDVTLYLDVGSQPVIERCGNMRFGPLGEQARGGWRQVLDFQYPGGDSPNWSEISADTRMRDLQIENGRPVPQSFGLIRSLDSLLAKLRENLISIPSSTRSASTAIVEKTI